MIKLAELKRACNEVISKTYPDIKITGTIQQMDIKGLRFLQRSFHTFLHTNQKIMLPEGQRLRPRFWKKNMMRPFVCLFTTVSKKRLA